MRTGDWIRLLDASYEMSEADLDWRVRVIETARPLFPRSPAVILLIARVTPDQIEVEEIETPGPPEMREAVLEVNDAGPKGVFDLMYRSGPVAGTLSERIFPRVPEARRAFLESARGAARDFVGAVGRADAGRMALLLAPLAEESTTTPGERRRWHLAMTHLGAGLRLRTALAGGDVDHESAEAVFDPGGELLHARGQARSPTAREMLRDAVVRIDKARSTAGSSDAIEAMEHWRGLVDGRWSLIDHFERDGKRFIVAHKNDPFVHDPRGLSVREKQISELIGMGRSTKEIAYELGLSLSAISMSAKAACEKLGLTSRAELALFFAPGGIRARLEEASIGEQDLLVGGHPLLDEAVIASLSDAEREIVEALLTGSTSAEIALRRGTAANTISNQIASIFDKLGVRSRIELASKVYTG